MDIISIYYNIFCYIINIILLLLLSKLLFGTINNQNNICIANIFVTFKNFCTGFQRRPPGRSAPSGAPAASTLNAPAPCGPRARRRVGEGRAPPAQRLVVCPAGPLFRARRGGRIPCDTPRRSRKGQELHVAGPGHDRTLGCAQPCAGLRVRQHRGRRGLCRVALTRRRARRRQMFQNSGLETLRAGAPRQSDGCPPAPRVMAICPPCRARTTSLGG